MRQFVADASHELRTPLATIRGYAELARRSPEYDPADALAKVEEEGVRMHALVEDLLLLARLDSGRPLEDEEVDLTMLALQTVEDARVVGRDHHWSLALPDEPVQVTGDEQRLHQVLSNLLANARRHTPAGTTVEVALARQNGHAVLSVTDDGPGHPRRAPGRRLRPVHPSRRLTHPRLRRRRPRPRPRPGHRHRPRRHRSPSTPTPAAPASP